MRAASSGALPILFAVALSCVLGASPPGSSGDASKQDRRILEDTHTALLHVDTLTRLVKQEGALQGPLAARTSASLDALSAGGVDLAGLAIWVPAGLTGLRSREYLDRMLEVARRALAACQDRARLVRTAAQYELARREGRTALLLTVEGGAPFEADDGFLDRCHRAGVRAIGLVWNESNALGSSWTASIARDAGLTEQGIRFVEKLNRLGVLVDVSHASDETIRDILARSRPPVMASHSNARALCHTRRNLPDELIRDIAVRGGVIGVSFHSSHLVQGRNPTIRDVARHCAHIRDVGGIDCVALGSDFDGGISPPRGLGSARDLPRLVAALRREGFDDRGIAKVCGENFLRLFRQVCRD